HGVFRVAGYLESLERGWANGSAEATVDVVSSSFVRIDGDNGFAQPALAAAGAEIDQALADTGVAGSALAKTRQSSALWPGLGSFARDGRVAMAMIASGKRAVVPAGATRPVFSTTPFASAAPVAGGDPVVFDLSTSAMS